MEIERKEKEEEIKRREEARKKRHEEKEKHEKSKNGQTPPGSPPKVNEHFKLKIKDFIVFDLNLTFVRVLKNKMIKSKST